MEIIKIQFDFVSIIKLSQHMFLIRKIEKLNLTLTL